MSHPDKNRAEAFSAWKRATTVTGAIWQQVLLFTFPPIKWPFFSEAAEEPVLGSVFFLFVSVDSLQATTRRVHFSFAPSTTSNLKMKQTSRSTGTEAQCAAPSEGQRKSITPIVLNTFQSGTECSVLMFGLHISCQECGPHK